MLASSEDDVELPVPRPSRLNYGLTRGGLFDETAAMGAADWRVQTTNNTGVVWSGAESQAVYANAASLLPAGGV